jgi:hypothetical protein
MAKSVPNAVMDVILDEIATATLMTVTKDVGTPANLTNKLADVAMAGGDYEKAEGDAGAGSRKVTMATKTDVDVDGAEAPGSPLHVVLSLGGTFKLVTTCTGPDLTTGSKVDFPAWKYEIGIPS